MMRHPRLGHQFVHYIPEKLEPSILYISVEHTVAIHLCCCGCGEKIVTPLAPGGWKMIFDGETISLRPSIGNWQLPCRSHYIIDEGEALEASPWERRPDLARSDDRDGADIETVVQELRERESPSEPRGLWQTLRERFFGGGKR